MSLSPAIVDAMVASGCSVEQLAAVMKAALAEDDKRLDERRAKDAERQRRHRASRDVTVTNGDSVTLPALSPSPNENNSNPHPHTHPVITTRARKGPVEKPEDVSDQVWGDWLDHRKRIKADVTPTAVAGVRREAAKIGWPIEQALAESVTQGWRGFKADWIEKRGTGPPGGNFRPIRGSSIASLLDDVRQVHGL